MLSSVSRRSFLGTGVAAFAIAPAGLGGRSTGPVANATDHFPLQDPALVREIVAASHGNLERVRALLHLHPALAEAGIDWGFGDWETALGAAAHTGRREIAELLIETGATPTVFSAAMLGHLDLVKAFIVAVPGIQRRYGAHSITLMAHARAGGEQAVEVRAYLERLADADVPPPAIVQSDADRARFVGTYALGDDGSVRVEVFVDRGTLAIRRSGGTQRPLRPVAPTEFRPAGAEAVRIRFSVSGNRATGFTVHDPELVVTATRID